MQNKLNLIGETYGRLLVIEEVDPYIQARGSKVRQYKCQCSCGKQPIVKQNNLRYGHTKSCGCYNSDLTTKRNTKHGHSKRGADTTLTYKRWQAMRTRCSNPNAINYSNYGGRGITYDPRWEDFTVFLEEMGECPPGLTLEREDVYGNYCKENCVWTTRKEQANNKRNNKLITCWGRTQTLTQWAEEVGIGRSTIAARLKKGWSVAEALTIPPVMSQKIKK